MPALGIKSWTDTLCHLRSLVSKIPIRQNSVSHYMNNILQFLERRFPGDGLNKDYREHISLICSLFLDSGYADSNFVAELISGSDTKFWSCMSEALVFARISNKLFGTRTLLGIGPDFLLVDGDQRAWLEVVSPEPRGLPKDWLEIQHNHRGSVPHDAILLRWTSAIKEKTEKLLGSADGMTKGYLEKEVVSVSDAYVIVVNGCQLRYGPFSGLHGISQFPYAAEAVFPIGPFGIQVDRNTLECVGSGHQERLSIKKPNGSEVSSYAFLEPQYNLISAIWAIDFNGGTVIGNDEPSALIHDPNASNPVPKGFLPSDEEYGATPCGNDEYTFARIK